MLLYINDSEIRILGWDNQKVFDNELPNIVSCHKKRVVW